jgi:hypothetical protein
MRNREIFVRDPSTATLPNDGVVAVSEGKSEKEIEALRYEIEHFVCEGQYHTGLLRIFDSYLGHVTSASQPAAWVSGFYGSGKSHLLKILRHLWTNTTFESDGARARDLAHLPSDIEANLVELDTFGKRCGGLHSVGGTLPSGGGLSPRLAVLRMLFKSKGLPEALPQAQFCLWLQVSGLFDRVKAAVEAAVQPKGKDFFAELHNMYVSPVLAKALLEADPSFASDIKQVRSLLREQFPKQDDLPTSDFIRIVRETLEVEGQMPATLIVLDEIQLYIAGSGELSRDVQEMAEALSKQLDSRVLLIGAGQTALAASDPLLERLRGRFTVSVELSDTDVETVTRKVVLAKKADKRSPIQAILDQNRGEIDRQLMGTRIATRSKDRDTIVDDYPLLPVRRRFWEHAIRAVDVPGTSSQLRTQLRMVHDAVRETADATLGTVVTADFLFAQQRPALLQSGALLKEIDETIQTLDDGTPDGVLAKRLCELIFLIRKLPREEGIDIGVRSTPEMLADLLVQDLATDRVNLRRDVPRVLEQLVEKGKLIVVEDGEYSLQTRESSEWAREYRNHQTRLNASLPSLASKRAALINARCSEVLRGTQLMQGESKVPRKLAFHFSSEPPATDGTEIPVWIRDGWGESESTVVADAREAGNESPTIFVYIPKASAEDLQKAIVSYAAAEATIHMKGTPTTREGQEAHDAMSTTMSRAEQTRDQIIRDVVDGTKVYQGGGNEQLELTLTAKVEAAAHASMGRLFPEFNDADDSHWKAVIDRARKGDEGALSAVGWDGPVEQHRVTAAVLREVGSGRQGKKIRAALSASPCGWPRDAIDAALIVLHTTDHLRARHKGVAVPKGELDQNKIPVTDFRTESVTLNAKQKMRLRKLFQDGGVDCKPNEEALKAGEYLARMLDLASYAGGEPPLPETPPTEHLVELRSFAGNEQLAVILEQIDVLDEQAKEWSQRGKLAAKRMPTWEQLAKLLDHAKDLPGVGELCRQADAVRDERRLLEATDPVPDILKAVTSLLRTELALVQEVHRAARKRHMDELEASEAWKQLVPEEQQQILATHGLGTDDAFLIESDDDLFRALEQTPLATRRTKTAALSQQFQDLILSVTTKLEPKTRPVKIQGGVLKNEAEVREWLAATEKTLLDEVKDGPIIIS